jgi:hypothetical protein
VNKTIQAIMDDLRPVDGDKMYDDMLDDVYSFEEVGGPFAYFLPSKVLEEMDPTAYRCGKADFLDSQRDEYVTFDGETFFDRRKVENAIDETIAEAESVLEEEGVDDDDKAEAHDILDNLKGWEALTE